MNEDDKENEFDYEAFEGPSFLKIIAEILAALKKEETNREDCKRLFENLMNELTHQKFYLEDDESESWLKTEGEDARTQATQLISQFMVSFIGNLSLGCIYEFWGIWAKARKRKTGKDLETLDRFSLGCMRFIAEKNGFLLYKFASKTNLTFNDLSNLANSRYSKKPEILIRMGTLFRKIKDAFGYMPDRGQELFTKGHILLAKDELRNEFEDSLNQKVENSKEKIQEESKTQIERSKKELDSSIKGVESRFIQIIGIFAAIIAFIVTIVPTAVRLGGASIPIALAGLAIVTVGIILVLAMIFGNHEEDRRKRLRGGFWGAIVAFVLWLGITLLLLFVKPVTLKPPPDPGRVDTVYQYQVDTVKTPIHIKPEQ